MERLDKLFQENYKQVATLSFAWRGGRLRTLPALLRRFGATGADLRA
jgi:hypothetical protein